MKLSVALALLALACNPVPGPVPPDDASDASPAPVVDAGAEDAEADAGEQDAGGLDDCELAYQKLRPGGVSERGCFNEVGLPLWIGPDDETFADRCRRDAAQMGWRIDCLRKITSCDQANAAVTGAWCGVEFQNGVHL
jgi:hypothetical protein